VSQLFQKLRQVDTSHFCMLWRISQWKVTVTEKVMRFIYQAVVWNFQKKIRFLMDYWIWSYLAGRHGQSLKDDDIGDSWGNGYPLGLNHSIPRGWKRPPTSFLFICIMSASILTKLSDFARNILSQLFFLEKIQFSVTPRGALESFSNPNFTEIWYLEIVMLKNG
jgi:hypothetical protein